MGSSSYRYMSAAAAKDAEFEGMDIIARSGNWVIARHRYDGDLPDLYYQQVRRYGDEVAVKTMHVCMGPAAPPVPRSLAATYLDYWGGDAKAAGGECGAPLLEAAFADTPVRITAGDRIRVHANPDRFWSDGAPLDGDYTFRYRFRFARGLDGAGVIFPKSWKRDWTWEKL